MQDYHDLLVWNKAFEFVINVYRDSSLFPKEEMFGLTSQLRRAGVSILGNIAEGRGKATDKDFLKFLYIARGSLNECECYMELALALKYISQEKFDIIEKKRKEVGFLLYKLITAIQPNNPTIAS